MKKRKKIALAFVLVAPSDVAACLRRQTLLKDALSPYPKEPAA